jgi:hypothetical protein
VNPERGKIPSPDSRFWHQKVYVLLFLDQIFFFGLFILVLFGPAYAKGPTVDFTPFGFLISFSHII